MQIDFNNPPKKIRARLRNTNKVIELELVNKWHTLIYQGEEIQNRFCIEELDDIEILDERELYICSNIENCKASGSDSTCCPRSIKHNHSSHAFCQEKVYCKNTYIMCIPIEENKCPGDCKKHDDDCILIPEDRKYVRCPECDSDLSYQVLKQDYQCNDNILKYICPACGLIVKSKIFRGDQK